MTIKGDSHVTPEILRNLESGELSWDEIQRLLRSEKEADRFDKYIQSLEGRTALTDPILLRLNEKLYIVDAPNGRVVRCGTCNHDFGDYRVNWKLSADIYVRRTREEILEVYYYEEVAPDEGYCQIREYYCPGCQTLLSVECVPPGYPPIFEFLPDVEGFYRDVLGRPLPGTTADSGVQDLTLEAVKQRFVVGGSA